MGTLTIAVFVILVLSFIFRCCLSTSCVFPSIGKHKMIKECQPLPGQNHWWCPDTPFHAIDKSANECLNTTTTFAGNDPGKPCHFPTTVNGVRWSSCLRKNRGFSSKWCPTTANFDLDKKWTYCYSSEKSQSPLLLPWALFGVALSLMLFTYAMVQLQRRRCSLFGRNAKTSTSGQSTRPQGRPAASAAAMLEAESRVDPTGVDPPTYSQSERDMALLLRSYSSPDRVV